MEKINIKTEDVHRGLPQETPNHPLLGDMITNGIASVPENTLATLGSIPPIPGYTGVSTHPGGPNGTMGDPSMQEYLSPFFQPFGVDVSHFPLTNPPIFQSSLANYSDGPRRRRISISNGQISQLGDETGNFEDLYYNQPPPLPPRQDFINAKNSSNSHGMNAKIAPRHPHSTYAQQPTGLVSQNAGIHTAPVANDMDMKDEEFDDDEEDSKSTVPINSFLSHGIYQEHRGRRLSNQDPLPGTAAWKRARLLERNRIAASKCRQRKKVAQQQLQKDVHQLSRENRDMRKKLDYYEKLVSKFKKFTEIHMSSCGGSKDQLNMIEEMLKIDHNMTDHGKGPMVKSGDARS